MSELAKIDIMYVAGVGPKKAKLLQTELGVRTAEDLLYVFPFRYVDRSQFYKIGQLDSTTSYVQIKGKITQVTDVGEGRRERLTALFSDGTDCIELLWFKGIKYVKSTLKTGVDYVLFGKPSLFNGHVNFVHPELETLNDAAAKHNLDGLQGIYNTTEKMKSGFLTSKSIRTIIRNVMDKYMCNYHLPETLPRYILDQYKMPVLDQCLRDIHFPKDTTALGYAQYRLKFEELFYIQLQLNFNMGLRADGTQGYLFGQIGSYFNDFYSHHLPFELTNAQKRVIKEIRMDLKSGKQMNRLLQGDVGSGKTLVALMTMLIALDNGFQACLMAPTEILATQHYHNLREMLEPMGISVGLLTGSTKTKARREMHEQLKNGDLKIMIGTHALIEDKVEFKNLGLAIIDEQHRFGVAQRAKLWKKNSQPPHILVMTATPIPRTLAMTIYGDLDVSTIDELPPGRHPIQTLHRFENRRTGVYDFIKKQIAEGRQAYIVYPLIKESENMDLQNLEQGYELMKSIFEEPTYHISMVHGQMPAAEKEAEMNKFISGETQILVSTTVIEVGVNVPNATVMVIESAERFGLSQLHQLRGRVGRGGNQSYCILLTSVKLSADSRKRMSIMTGTTNGFEISEADLQMRGPGDLEGVQQSGVSLKLRIANLAKDGNIVQQTRSLAKDILKEDPKLALDKNNLLLRQVQKMNNRIDWGAIS